MKLIKIMLIGIVSILLLTGCKDDNQKKPDLGASTEIETVESSKDSDILEKEVLEKGFKISDYNFFLLNDEKYSENDKEMVFQNLKTNITSGFLKIENRINQMGKTNIIPYACRYDMSSEEVDVGYFLINNSNQTIKSITIKGRMDFKNIDFDDTVNIDYPEKSFTELPPKGFVMFNIQYPAPYDKYFDLLKENQITDLSFEIEELAINGEKVDTIN